MGRISRGALAKQSALRRLAGYAENGYPVGEGHHRAKLKDADVEQIHALRAYGLSYRAIAEKFDDIPGGISIRTVRDILTFRKRATLAVRFKPRP